MTVDSNYFQEQQQEAKRESRKQGSAYCAAFQMREKNHTQVINRKGFREENMGHSKKAERNLNVTAKENSHECPNGKSVQTGPLSTHSYLSY